MDLGYFGWLVALRGTRTSTRQPVRIWVVRCMLCGFFWILGGRFVCIAANRLSLTELVPLNSRANYVPFVEKTSTNSRTCLHTVLHLHLILALNQSTSPSPTNTNNETFMTQISSHRATAMVAVSQLFFMLIPPGPPSPSLVATVMYLLRQVR
jgi:hypothetical protein